MGGDWPVSKMVVERTIIIGELVCNQSVYEPLNLENGLVVNSDNFDATDVKF